MLNVDVLICTHNDGARIPQALGSLRAQSIGCEKFRVIVVDNASTDNTEELVRCSADGLDLTYVKEPRLGIYHAFSAGYYHSRAAYVAHLDADARAHPRWLERILQVISDVEPGLCGGPYYPYYLEPKPAWFLDKYNSNYHGDQARYLVDDEYLSGTNMIWRRSLVDALGGFKPGIGLAGRGVARGDETELIIRARHADRNFQAYYDPNIIVYHLTRPQTFSMVYWLRRYFAAGRNYSVVFEQARRPSAARRLRYFARAARVILSAPVQLLYGLTLRDRKRYPYFANFLYEQFLPRATILGQAYTAFVPHHGPL